MEDISVGKEEILVSIRPDLENLGIYSQFILINYVQHLLRNFRAIFSLPLVQYYDEHDIFV